MPETANANLAVASALVEELVACGVRNFCIAPGSRSTPVVLALAECAQVRDWIIHDERGGAYFALGMAGELCEPVAIVCTSGTAAANFLPAVVEASLACVPLIVLTADRPSELRGFGAAQTIDQVGIYGSHVRWNFDVAPPCGHEAELPSIRALGCRAVTEATAAPAGPVHLNLCFREPLLDRTDTATVENSSDREPAAATNRDSVQSPLTATQKRPPTHPHTRVHANVPTVDTRAARELAAAMSAARRGLIVCGPRTGGSAVQTMPGETNTGAERTADAVARLAARLDWPILADALSGLRFGSHDLSRVVVAHDLLLREPEFTTLHQPDFVLHFGVTPVSKATGQWLARLRGVRHALVAEPGLWPDPQHTATDLIRTTTLEFCNTILAKTPATPSTSEADWPAAWTEAGQVAYGAIQAEVAGQDPNATLCEAVVPGLVLNVLSEPATVAVGNSMPVRDLDSFVAPRTKQIRVTCNRGANGIDGVVSASLGAAAVSAGPTVLITGDLSFLHDVSALQLATRLQLKITIVVVNNNGGGVFSFLPQANMQAGKEDLFERYFATPHGLDLGPIARSCGARYTRVDTVDQLTRCLANAIPGEGIDIIEVPSDRAANVVQHERLMESARQALREALQKAA